MPYLSQSGKVLALAGTRDVFQAATDTKEHLCASSTAGDVIPPMHIFSGQRFQYKPLEDGINRVYSSMAGWPITLSSAYYQFELSFYLSTVTQPTLISKLHMEKAHVFLFIGCLHIDSSHITQPLDVGIFRPMKQAWKKTVVNYAADHTGKSVSDIGHLLEHLRSLRFKIPTIVICFVQQVHAYIQLISLNEATLKRLGSQTMEKLAVRYQEGYDLKTYRFGLN